jgi:hypothetical protein
MTDAEIRRQLERELDHASWRAARPLFLGMLLVLVSLWAWSAHAATATLKCTPPTQNTNDTPITASLGYKAYWGTSATALTNDVDLAGPGCAGSVVVPDPAPGATITYHFAVTAITAYQESAKSNVVAKTFSTPRPTPKPPTLLTSEQIGYQLNLGTRNKITLSRVASVPIGKECITSMSVTDPYRTVYLLQDRLWATMDPNPKKPGEFFTRPNQVWAKCKTTG